MTHITWSIERDGRCPACGGAVALAVAPPIWAAADSDDEITIHDEVTAHVCVQCGHLVSLSLNTTEAQ